MSSPLISLCIPAYNRARFLGSTLESLIGQTFTDFEIIVVDDCSPDDTAEVVASFDDSRIRYYRNEINLGVPFNYNYVLSLARGEFVCLFGDHDLADPCFLEKSLEIMRGNSEVVFTIPGLVVIDEQDRPVERYEKSYPKIISGEKMLKTLLVSATCPFPITTVIRREFIEKLSLPFDPQYWWYCDINLWMKLSSMGKVGYVKEPILMMRKREKNHFLKGKDWETLFCVDAIHMDNWGLLHPNKSFSSYWNRLCYEYEKFFLILKTKMNKIYLKGGVWGKEDRLNEIRYLSVPARYMVSMLDFIPGWVSLRISKLYVKWWRWCHT
ncbi:MAG: glycosyltransferase family 2 protein [Nitrospinaceae bacterium]|nr:glycosyltransferase family 2 protein [Nitrospinaceae bacterium]